MTRQPRRLWRRYVYFNPAYLALLTLQASGVRRLDSRAAFPPWREPSVE